MDFLIDTHALLWWAVDDSRLSKSIRSRLDKSSVLFASSIALYEVYQKVTIGKLQLSRDIGQHLEKENIQILPFTKAHAEAARLLPLHHRDPFDRMMIGQAQIENLTFVTADEQIWRYDVKLLKA